MKYLILKEMDGTNSEHFSNFSITDYLISFQTEVLNWVNYHLFFTVCVRGLQNSIYGGA